jgi:gamma-glutamyltranspeptidase/glutathione hydrolase
MALLLLTLACARHVAPAGQPGGAVAADHPLASEAGAAVLRAGGNAVDAAIAAALSSGVVQPSGSGLGGGGFALIVSPAGEAWFLDFREVAPLAATRDMFQSAAPEASTAGGLAVAVPAEGIGLAELHRRWGRAPPGRVAAAAILQAEQGFPTGAHLEHSLLAVPAMRVLFGDGNRRPALASALRAWVDTGGEAFRTGWVAQDMVDAAQAAGGNLAMADLERYAPKERAPLRGSFAGRTVWTAPPPSSGGAALLEILGAGERASLHCRVEAAKHAMAERASVGGDPDFAPYDASTLIAAANLERIRRDCGPRTWPSDHYAPSVQPPQDAGTLHISAMDDEGDAVALTTTINTGFGSRVVAPRSGIVLNNEMDDFAARPGVANAFGLVQGEANAVAPGKRPLSSMTPTVVLDPDGRPEVVVGGSGGPFIITATAQVVAAILEEGESAGAAVAAHRWHHQWLPDVVVLEPGDPRATELEAAGHATRTIDSPFSAVQVVRRVGETWQAASDRRKGGVAVSLR